MTHLCTTRYRAPTDAGDDSDGSRLVGFALLVGLVAEVGGDHRRIGADVAPAIRPR